MSVKVMAEVWELDLPSTKKLVLLALADHADDNGEKVFPSVARVAWKSGLSDRQTRRIISQLRDDGLIVQLNRSGSGRGATNQYRIDTKKGDTLTPFKQGVTPTTEEQTEDEKGDKLTAGYLTPVSPPPDTGVTLIINEPPKESPYPTGGTPDGAKAEEEQPQEQPKEDGRTRSQLLVDELHLRLKDRYGTGLEPKQFGFHIGRFNRILYETDNPPTQPELLRVMARIVDRMPADPKMDAVKALQDVRYGRDTGEAWSDPPPWEEAARERGPINPHSGEAEEMRDSPRKALWYQAAYGLSAADVDGLLKRFDTHSDITQAIEDQKIDDMDLAEGN